MAAEIDSMNRRPFAKPLPVIGVRRVIMQCRAHDDDHAAPAVAPGPEIPMSSAFQTPTPERCFFRGWDIGGFVDSWPETLVSSASNRSTAEWTLVDSVDGDSTKSNFALVTNQAPSNAKIPAKVCEA